uniref:Uncharacterized protein n=1 Tax=Rhizophora mucronata TaxID=61149 RepID=A0A2P2M4E0_RHIMU
MPFSLPHTHTHRTRTSIREREIDLEKKAVFFKREFFIFFKFWWSVCFCR